MELRLIDRCCVRLGSSFGSLRSSIGLYHCAGGISSLTFAETADVLLAVVFVDARVDIVVVYSFDRDYFAYSQRAFL